MTSPSLLIHVTQDELPADYQKWLRTDKRLPPKTKQIADYTIRHQRNGCLMGLFLGVLVLGFIATGVLMYALYNNRLDNALWWSLAGAVCVVAVVWLSRYMRYEGQIVNQIKAKEARHGWFIGPEAMLITAGHDRYHLLPHGTVDDIFPVTRRTVFQGVNLILLDGDREKKLFVYDDAYDIKQSKLIKAVRRWASS